ncbi:MAG TPA: hypothetical protein VHO02_09130, partial [Fibrobacteria bacterium]|nr:hypothetical protein [Fibrobacteria bacterium]
MWNAQSRKNGGGTRYDLADLDFLINSIRIDMDIQEEDTGMHRDSASYMRLYSFFEGLSNGEYYCSLRNIFIQTISEQEARTATLFEEALVHHLIEDAIDGFRDMWMDGHPKEFKASGNELIHLYKTICSNSQMDLWLNEEGEPADMPALESLTREDFDTIKETIVEEFTWGDTDWTN